MAVQLQVGSIMSEMKRGNSTIAQHIAEVKQQLEAAQHDYNFQGESSGQEGSVITQLERSLDQLLKQPASPTSEMRVLKQLYFNSIFFREDHVEEPSYGTFQWLLAEEEPVVQLDSAAYIETDSWKAAEPLATEQCKWEEHLERAHKKRLEARSVLLTWLSKGNGIFHISGRAGCGKSTLMKMILNHEATKRKLNIWADNNQLVIAQFFFFRASTPEARSLEGLYRSILFETLLQHPGLVPLVFPGAYQAFERNAAANSIDETFFRIPQLHRAMERFVGLCSNLQYRFCFLIDGLDEFGEDNAKPEDYQFLAETLMLWASGGIKLLVSSRPHQEFLSTFSGFENIHLHELNEFDILQFGREKFERHKSFSRIKDVYEPLLKEISDRSNGIFLWAHLVIAQLLLKLSLGESIPSLKRQLETTPQTISELYRNVLASVDVNDRSKTFKLLWLAITLLRQGETSFPLIAVSWLDELFDDESFPVSSDIGPYSIEEINNCQSRAILQLNYYTRGLLEVMEKAGYSEAARIQLTSPSFMEKVVVFLHRTVYDFIRQSEDMRKYSAEYSITVASLLIKVTLANLWFQNTEHATISGDMMHDRFQIWNSEIKSNRNQALILLNAMKTAVQYHIDRGSRRFPGRATDFAFTMYKDSAYTLSWSYWVLFYLRDENLIMNELKIMNLLDEGDEMLSPLLTAVYKSTAAHMFADSSTRIVEYLLRSGVSPNKRITAKYRKFYISASVWHYFCVILATNWLLRAHPRRLNELQSLLLAELPRHDDSDIDFFDALKDATHYITLLELVQQLDPDNHHKWAMEFGVSPNTSWLRYSKPWTLLTAHWRQPTTPALPGQYIPFKPRMDSPDVFQDGYEYDNSFRVHSVIIGKTMLPAHHLKVRYV